MSKSVLITNYEITQYSGSEINASTIAKRMKELGYKVYMAALSFDDPLYSDVKDNFDVCIDLKKDEFDFSSIEFEIIWSHHFFLLDWLIFDKKVKAKKIIYSSLSGKEYFEAPPIYANELNLVLANSPETEHQLNIDGVQNVQLFENYSFLEYFNRDIQIKDLKQIAIVSNHIPEELNETTKLLRENGYVVDIYGIEGKQELITDKVLEKYDAVITIGKTVQYCMSLKIPVYVYDRFGGAGYLKMSNMEQNRAHNFSGRSYEKKNKEELYRDIIEDFPNVLKELEQIKQYALENFCFEKKVDKLINQLNTQNDVNLETIREKYKKYSRNLMASKNLIIYIQRKQEKIKEKEKDQVAFDYLELQKVKLNEKDEEIGQYKEKIKKLERINSKTSMELKTIKNSKSWEIIEKLRKIRKKIKGEK